MKKITITLLLFFGLVSMAQNNRISLPDGFSYKALLVENGNPVANSIITVKVTFKENSTTRWIETHSNVHTDANGIFSIYIGEGTRVSGTVSHFNSLDWHVSNMNLTVEVDSGSGYVPLVSGEKLAYMPFAKYAKKAYSATTATNASHLNPQTDSGIQLTTTSGGIGHGYRLTKDTEDWYLYMDASNDFVIRNDASDVFKIFNASNNVWINENVGIGETNPTERLHITGNSREKIKIQTTNNSSSSALVLKTNGSVYDYLNIEKKGSTASGTIGGISIANLSLINAGTQADAMMLDVMTDNPMYFLTNNHLAVTIENTGNVKFEKSITAEDSGNADMKAYVYGYIDENANIDTSRSSSGFTVTKHHVAAGSGYDYYKIAFNDTTINDNFIALANVDSGQAKFCTVAGSNDSFYVYIYDHSGAHVTDQFHFVVYRK